MVNDPLFSIPTESVIRCMFGANLVIPAQICDELSCGKGKVYGQTDGRTDRQTDRRRQQQYLFGLKGQGVKSYASPLRPVHVLVIGACVCLCLVYIKVGPADTLYPTKQGTLQHTERLSRCVIPFIKIRQLWERSVFL